MFQKGSTRTRKFKGGNLKKSDLQGYLDEFGESPPPTRPASPNSPVRENSGGTFRSFPVRWFSSKKSKRVKRDSVSDDDSPKGGKSSWRSSILGDLSPTSLVRSSVVLEDESDEDEEEREEKMRRIRDSVTMERIRGKDLETKRDRAFQNCGTVEHPAPGAESWMLRTQRKTGILELRVGVQVKKIQQEEEPPYYKDLHGIVSSIKFEAFIGALIVLNAICIGWDTFFLSDQKRPAILTSSENVFTAIFLIEWFLRVFAFSSLWLCNAMNLFDTFLIWIAGVLVLWILLPLGAPVQVARRLGALRILRLARLIRAIRIMPLFKELWMLVQGVMECTTLLLWASVIGGMVHFTFAVLVLELLVKRDDFKDDEQVQEHFGSTIRAMFSLFQIMTLDSWSGIVRPIIQVAPEALLIFGLFMGFSSIVLFNLLTAIVVQNAYDAGARDIEAVAMSKMQEQRRVSTELLETFKDLDEDGSGALSREEFTDCLDDYQFVRKMKMLDIDLEELPDFFDILDDGDGEVDQDEFVGGMMKMQGPAMSAEMLKATTLIRQQNGRFADLLDAFVVGPLDTFVRVEGDMDSLHKGMNDIMQLTAEVMQKLDGLGVRRIAKSTVKDVPFVVEPEIEDVIKAEKRFTRQKKRGKEVKSDWDIDHLVPAEARMKTTVPPTWIIREGRTFAAKNPGKMKLVKDPELKHRLQNKSNQIKAKKAASDNNMPIGVHQEMSAHWNTMGAPLDEFGRLRKVAAEEDGNAPPEVKLHPLVNSMADCLVPTVVKPKSKAGPAPPAGAPPVLSPTGQTPAVRSFPEVAANLHAPAPTSPTDLESPMESPEHFANMRRSLQVEGDARQLFEHPNAVPADTLL